MNLASSVQMITMHNFCTVSVTRVQKYVTSKEEHPSCDQSAITTDFKTGEVFCSHCGFVLSERVEDSGFEWHSFSGDKSNSGRTGSGTSLAKHDQGLSTIINSINKDASGKPLSFTMKKILKQLRMLDRRSQTHAPINKNFIQAFSEFNRLKD